MLNIFSNLSGTFRYLEEAEIGVEVDAILPDLVLHFVVEEDLEIRAFGKSFSKGLT